jgi:hypothetical protein
MNWDFFNGFWAGALALVFVEVMLISFVDENDGDDDSDDDDYHYEPIDDDHNHFQPA